MDDIREQIVLTKARAEYLSESTDMTDAEMHKSNVATMEKLLATLKDVQKLAGDCYQGASEREPILVIAQIWEAANEVLAAVHTTEQIDD